MLFTPELFFKVFIDNFSYFAVVGGTQLALKTSNKLNLGQKLIT